MGDSIMTGFPISERQAGISVLITQHGKSVYQKQIGMANVKKNISLQPSTRFNIGSVSKQFTAYCIYLLEQQGKLKRSDSIQQYFPNLPTFGHTITLNHLLSHTSGIPDHFEMLGLQNNYSNQRMQPDYVIRFLQKHPQLMFVPGQRFAYCNTGYMLLAMLVEKVSGLSIDQYSQDNLFKPASLSSFSFQFHEQAALHHQIISYRYHKQKFKPIKKPSPNAMGATGVFSTLGDLATWYFFLLHPDKSPLPPAVLQAMKNTHTLSNHSSVHYGGGLIVKDHQIEHSGGWNEFLLQSQALIEEDIIIIVASNSSHHNVFGICDAFHQAIRPSKQIPFQTKHLFTEPVPESLFMDHHNVFRVLKKNQDTLQILSYHQKNKEISKLYFQEKTDSSYIFKDKFENQFELNRNLKSFTWMGGHYFTFQRSYSKLDSTTPVAHCVGKYIHPTSKQKLTIKKRGQQIRVWPKWFISYPLQHVGGTVYQIKNEPIYLRFENNTLQVGNEWVFDLTFYKQ